MEFVFVLGAPRSGTSMLGWAIAQHPNFEGCPEIDFIVELAGFGRLRQAYDRSLREDGFLSAHEVGYDEFAQALGRGLGAVVESRVEGQRIVDSTPRHSRIWRELSVLFPSSRFIHILRDGRDVVRSLKASGFPARSASGFIAACLAYRKYVSSALDLESALPERTLRVEYDAVTADPERAMEEILAFLGETGHPACAEFIRNRRVNASFGTSFDAAGDLQHRPARNPWSGLNDFVFRTICGRVLDKLESSQRDEL